jgi:UDP-GlcNAc:undecaprenyl-phosphate/decaprenyl-phosphate GlcNAc-1-phosphate transferase
LANLVLRESELRRLLLLILSIGYLFGLAGLAVLICMEWITRGRYAQDSVSKHGIGHESSSRLGGAVIMVAALIGITTSQLFQFSALGLDTYLWSWVAIVLCGLLGLVEDFKNNLLSPRFRLTCVTAIFVVLFTAWPWLIPVELGVPILSSLMALPVIGLLLAVILCVGFINAVNMADGANGLMSGIAFVAFALFASIAGADAWVWGIISYIVGVFFIFNVVSGRLFLGDCGAYALGSMMVIGSFSLVNKGLVSPAFLAVLFAYPCLELVISLIRRTVGSQSAFLPDNDHFHNRLHYFVTLRVTSPVIANSGTGLLIVLMTSGVAFAGHYLELLSATDGQWGYVFLVIACLHLFFYWALGLVDQRVSQYVVGA